MKGASGGTPNVLPVLDASPDEALFTGLVAGLIMICRAEERPLQGLAGRVDWWFHGLLSTYVRKGVITGKAGECIYIPAARPGDRSEKPTTFHLLLVGADPSTRVIADESLERLKKNLQSLKISPLGLSLSNWGTTKLEDWIHGGPGVQVRLLR